MPKSLADLLDFDLAWKRVKKDAATRNFVRHPHEIDLIEIDLSDWLTVLRNAVESDTYHPHPPTICDVPKGKGAIRPGAHLDVGDRVVYAACVGACLAKIARETAWARKSVDFSYPLTDDPSDPDWIRSKFSGWRDFETKSLQKIDAGYGYVVIADVSGFYENIDLATLMSDLRQIGVPQEAINQISTCLNRWAVSQGRGIPQGQTPSDILAKLYLNSIDQNLKQMGFDHHRYVDDIRIFCRNRAQAKLALLELTRVLRHKGLCLQGAKSEIHLAEDAKRIISGAAPVIRGVARKFVRDIANALASVNPYMGVAEAESILLDGIEEGVGSGTDQTPMEVIRQAYRDHFIDGDGSFDKSLFHFLLNRLANQKDDFAVEHASSLFEKHPEETRDILRYVRGVGGEASAEERIAKFLECDENIYAYQTYEIIEWYTVSDLEPPATVLAEARKRAFDTSQPAYLRAVCVAMLGDFGTIADLDRLEHHYRNTHSALEQTEVMCAIRRMEPGRRNAFLARSERDGDLHRRASTMVRRTSR